MAIPAYMWLKDDGGSAIKGSVDVKAVKTVLRSLSSNTMSAFLQMPITGKLTRHPRS